ncbi:MAG: hypothetical protein V4721_11320 [Bacteroidota bacterium]
MKAIILCVLTLFIGLVSQAQSTTASLNITLTDVQSVTFSSVALAEASSPNQDASKNGSLQLLSHSTSQIKKISSQNSEYERLYKEFYSTTTASQFSDKNVYAAATNSSSPPKSAKNKNTSNLVIYQIDPR